MAKKELEVIVRGVLIRRRRLLLCRNVKRGHIFLPGGHVDFGEPAQNALAREMREETGLAVRIGRFLGASEASFSQRGKQHHEINLVFELTIPKRAADARITSVEKHIQFMFVPLAKVLGPRPSIRVLPRGVLPILRLAGGRLRSDQSIAPFHSDWS